MTAINCLLVISVTPGSAAENAGLLKGDYIIRYNDQPISSNEELSNAIALASSKDSASLDIIRANQEIRLNISTGKLGVSFKPSITLNSQQTLPENQNSESTSLISLLSLFAWLSLFLGTIGGIIIFIAFGTEKINDTTSYNIIGVAASIASVVQGIFAFVVFEVIATMALDIKAIKKNHNNL